MSRIGSPHLSSKYDDCISMIFHFQSCSTEREKHVLNVWTSERLHLTRSTHSTSTLPGRVHAESMHSPCGVHSPKGTKGHQRAPKGTKGHQRAPKGTKGHQRAPKGTKGHQRARVVGSYSLIFSNSKKILGTPILRNTHWQSLQICCLDKSSERRLAHRIAAFQHISLDQKACRHELPKGQTTRSKKENNAKQTRANPTDLQAPAVGINKIGFVPLHDEEEKALQTRNNNNNIVYISVRISDNCLQANGRVISFFWKWSFKNQKGAGVHIGTTALRSWERYRAQVCSICEWVENACIKENMDEQWMRNVSKWNKGKSFALCPPNICLLDDTCAFPIFPFPSWCPVAWILASQTASDGGICTRTQSIGKECNTSLRQLVATPKWAWMAALSSRISGKSLSWGLGERILRDVSTVLQFTVPKGKSPSHIRTFSPKSPKLQTANPKPKKYKKSETNLRQIHQAPVSPLCRLPSAKELNSWERDWILASAERTALNLGGRWWQVFGFWMWFVGWPPCGSWHSDHSG